MAKRKAPKSAWKKGQSGNPKGGRPKSDDTWAAHIRAVGQMTGVQAGRKLALVKTLVEVGDKVTLKRAVVLRVYAALLYEPTASLWQEIMDRDEGKVSQSIDVKGDAPLLVRVDK